MFVALTHYSRDSQICLDHYLLPSLAMSQAASSQLSSHASCHSPYFHCFERGWGREPSSIHLGNHYTINHKLSVTHKSMTYDSSACENIFSLVKVSHPCSTCFSLLMFLPTKSAHCSLEINLSCLHFTFKYHQVNHTLKIISHLNKKSYTENVHAGFIFLLFFSLNHRCCH